MGCLALDYALEVRLVVVNEAQINKATLSEGVSILLVMEGPHVVFAKKFAGGRFDDINPGTG